MKGAEVQNFQTVWIIGDIQVKIGVFAHLDGGIRNREIEILKSLIERAKFLDDYVI